MIQTTATDQHMRVTALGLSTCTSIFAETQDKVKKFQLELKIRNDKYWEQFRSLNKLGVVY